MSDRQAIDIGVEIRLLVLNVELGEKVDLALKELEVVVATDGDGGLPRDWLRRFISFRFRLLRLLLGLFLQLRENLFEFI